MQAHYLQHVSFEGLGSIKPWLLRFGFEISHTRLFAGDILPDPADIDMLVIMGGPMSVNDELNHPWLVREKDFILNIINLKKPVLGICLGAQLIASALSARIYPGKYKEIGWFDIEGEPEQEGYFNFPRSHPAFHWHGETFDLPAGAKLLASSQGCRNQAFQLGESVIGLQFHLETTLESARNMVENCRDELIEERFIQTEQEILEAPEEGYQAINQLMGDILSFLKGKIKA